MRYADNLADYTRAKEDGLIDDDVFVIVLEEQVAIFKGKTFDWSAKSGGEEELEAYMPLSRDFSDDFNNDFTR